MVQYRIEIDKLEELQNNCGGGGEERLAKEEVGSVLKQETE